MLAHWECSPGTAWLQASHLAVLGDTSCPLPKHHSSLMSWRRAVYFPFCFLSCWKSGDDDPLPLTCRRPEGWLLTKTRTPQMRCLVPNPHNLPKRALSPHLVLWGPHTQHRTEGSTVEPPNDALSSMRACSMTFSYHGSLTDRGSEKGSDLP